MDVLIDTDFPDIRTKCAIQSGAGGNVVVIPREGDVLSRMYVDLGDIAPDDAGKVRETPLERIVEIAQGIFQPYRLDVRHVAWWSVYEVGQRVTDTFDDVKPKSAEREAACVHRRRRLPHPLGEGRPGHERVDAGHLQPGWKLGSVLAGRSPSRCSTPTRTTEVAQSSSTSIASGRRSWAQGARLGTRAGVVEPETSFAASYTI